jgi:hypothetical protein
MTTVIRTTSPATVNTAWLTARDADVYARQWWLDGLIAVAALGVAGLMMATDGVDFLPGIFEPQRVLQTLSPGAGQNETTRCSRPGARGCGSQREAEPGAVYGPLEWAARKILREVVSK